MNNEAKGLTTMAPIDPVRESMFPDGGKALSAWLDGGWRPGAPPFDRVSPLHVWQAALGYKSKAGWVQLEAINRQLALLGWSKVGNYFYRPLKVS
jgi:hypothetical protein